MERGLVKDMGDNNSFDLTITVITRPTNPWKGLT